MKIKQIELSGFKSFFEKTVFPLHDGITCIVGPNGCGKSNIVDAFRWVLGEQSAKSLRGDKMEEVIFQGSATKKPKGMAEVNLTLTISSGAGPQTNDDDIPSEPPDSSADQVLITRRLYRSGESEYLLNKRVCRLKDIRDILLDTGLDVKSYSILDQNRIADIVHSRPQDRRFLIEEIAGVMKYKVRKAEAESKLDTSRQNLLRISDVISERKRQLNSIDRLARKAERYKKLITEAQLLETKIAKGRHAALDLELRNVTEQISVAEEKDASLRASISEGMNRLETKRILLSEIQRDLSDIEQELQSRERALAALEKKSAVLRTNIENRHGQINLFNEQEKENDAKQTETRQRLLSMESVIGGLQSSIYELSEKTKRQTEKLSVLEGVLKSKEQEAEHQRREIFRLSDSISTKKNELSKRHSHMEHLDYREETAHRDKDNTAKTIESLQGTIQNIELQIKELTNESATIEEKKRDVQTQIRSAEGELQDIRNRLASERESLAGEVSRLKSIKELFEDDPVSVSLRDSSDKPLDRLSDLIEADKEYETSLEASLSDRINSFVVTSRDELFRLIKLISERSLPQVRFLYKGFHAEERQNTKIPQVEGLIGRASDFIHPTIPDDRAVALLRSELENIFIIRDIEKAVEYIEQERPSGITFITPTGDSVSSSGWISSGRGTEILRIKREGRELELSINQRHIRISESEHLISTKTSDIISLKKNASELQTLISEKDKRISLSRHNLEESRKELERKQRRLESLDQEFATLQYERSEVQTQIDTFSGEINALETQRDALQASILSVQQEISSNRSSLDRERSIDTSLRLEVASLSERLESAKKEQRTLAALVDELDKSREANRKNREDTARLIEEETMQLRDIDKKTGDGASEITRISSEYNSKKETLVEENELAEEIEGAIKGMRAEIDDLSTQLAEMNKRAFEKRLHKENIENIIHEKYGIDINTFETEGGATPEEESRLQDINEKIREMGPVSLDTIAEYEELKNSYDFLLRQQEDLNLSITELEEAINRINSTTKRRLREAFNALKDSFNSVFSTLFGGGRADILLTDQENILESGLEIIAQPPGKKNQNLNQLSGGEKALTSLALLFAGFMIKPSPLCILDEAEAALDESNTERFAAMLKDLSKETQFIIITHNRVTMEAADYLYGITTEEPGVSKSISLQFSDA